MDENNDKVLALHVWIVCSLGLFIDGYDLYIASVAEPFINALYHPSPLMMGSLRRQHHLGQYLVQSLLGA